jgi:hypothetical protein
MNQARNTDMVLAKYYKKNQVSKNKLLFKI